MLKKNASLSKLLSMDLDPDLQSPSDISEDVNAEEERRLLEQLKQQDHLNNRERQMLRLKNNSLTDENFRLRSMLEAHGIDPNGRAMIKIRMAPSFRETDSEPELGNNEFSDKSDDSCISLPPPITKFEPYPRNRLSIPVSIFEREQNDTFTAEIQTEPYQIDFEHMGSSVELSSSTSGFTFEDSSTPSKVTPTKSSQRSSKSSYSSAKQNVSDSTFNLSSSSANSTPVSFKSSISTKSSHHSSKSNKSSSFNISSSSELRSSSSKRNNSTTKSSSFGTPVSKPSYNDSLSDISSSPIITSSRSSKSSKSSLDSDQKSTKSSITFNSSIDQPKKKSESSYSSLLTPSKESQSFDSSNEIKTKEFNTKSNSSSSFLDTTQDSSLPKKTSSFLETSKQENDSSLSLESFRESISQMKKPIKSFMKKKESIESDSEYESEPSWMKTSSGDEESEETPVKKSETVVSLSSDSDSDFLSSMSKSSHKKAIRTKVVKADSESDESCSESHSTYYSDSDVSSDYDSESEENIKTRKKSKKNSISESLSSYSSDDFEVNSKKNNINEYLKHETKRLPVQQSSSSDSEFSTSELLSDDDDEKEIQMKNKKCKESDAKKSKKEKIQPKKIKAENQEDNEIDIIDYIEKKRETSKKILDNFEFFVAIKFEEMDRILNYVNSKPNTPKQETLKDKMALIRDSLKDDVNKKKILNYIKKYQIDFLKKCKNFQKADALWMIERAKKQIEISV